MVRRRSALCEWVGSRIPALGEGADVARPYSTEDVDRREECTGDFLAETQRQESRLLLADRSPVKAVKMLP